jgi:hypothetical protein
MPKKNKCFSNCRLFEKAECNPPRCKFVNGQTLKYCRLSHNYKMKKPACNVTRRIKKKEQSAHAKKVIETLVKRSKKHLAFICSDSGNCIAFGRNIAEINTFFKGFTDFTYAISPINQIGALSENGFVIEIPYEKEGYNAYAILKSAKKRSSDNLVYEYLVGIKYVNRIMKQFPCFLETYGLYYYPSPVEWTAMSGTGPVLSSSEKKLALKQLLLQSSIDYSKACRESQYAAILIQHLKNVKTIHEYTYLNKYNNFMKRDMLYVLFIIYHTLASISKEFTHYDLHDSNVLVYEPENGKYIKYHYHHKDGTETTFHSPYIPKIIDYGRSFFDNGNLNSKKIYDKICLENDCKPECGERVGFTWLDPKPTLTISSSKKNESHDLRLLKTIATNMELVQMLSTGPVPTLATFVETNKVLRKVVYGVSITDPAEKMYGTKENLKITNPKIYNVKGAYLALKEVIHTREVIAENDMNYYRPDDLIGTLHIYEDGTSMKYE